MKSEKEGFLSKYSTIRFFYLSILAIAILSVIFLSINKDSIQFSPDDSTSTMTPENAALLLSSLSDPGIDWYCGERESYTDNLGNTYGDLELMELKRILGNEDDLMNRFCD